MKKGETTMSLSVCCVCLFAVMLVGASCQAEQPSNAVDDASGGEAAVEAADTDLKVDQPGDRSDALTVGPDIAQEVVGANDEPVETCPEFWEEFHNVAQLELDLENAQESATELGIPWSDLPDAMPPACDDLKRQVDVLTAKVERLQQSVRAVTDQAALNNGASRVSYGLRWVIYEVDCGSVEPGSVVLATEVPDNFVTMVGVTLYEGRYEATLGPINGSSLSVIGGTLTAQCPTLGSTKPVLRVAIGYPQ